MDRQSVQETEDKIKAFIMDAFNKKKIIKSGPLFDLVIIYSLKEKIYFEYQYYRNSLNKCVEEGFLDAIRYSFIKRPNQIKYVYYTKEASREEALQLIPKDKTTIL